jgi:two-component system, cell cycle sensor histidine kinase and response regulator CckA
MIGQAKVGTILVVDDNVDIRWFARLFLETAGYAVVTAADGQEGLRLYQQHQSDIVLLLTDVVMPNLNGLELAHRVLEIDPQLPVLFMSGQAGGGYRGSEFLAKPFRPTALVEGVGRALNANAYSETAESEKRFG